MFQCEQKGHFARNCQYRSYHSLQFSNQNRRGVKPSAQRESPPRNKSNMDEHQERERWRNRNISCRQFETRSNPVDKQSAAQSLRRSRSPSPRVRFQPSADFEPRNHFASVFINCDLSPVASNVSMRDDTEQQSLKSRCQRSNGRLGTI